uniref:Bloodthirsty-related gene family, member 26 n=1 Tax=Hippocampus comes TaxID=109280 RepID=A0A3Q2YEG5_HIPCM
MLVPTIPPSLPPKMDSPCGGPAQKQLECPLCEQVLNDPVTTPCGHNFCQACLQRRWGDGKACRCPACDKAFTNRPEISVNAAFKKLADTFKRMTLGLSSSPPPRDGEVPCDVCAAASLQVRALQSCLVCLTSYCHTHLEAHRSVATLMMHRLIAPAANLRERLCGQHDQLLEMFCRDEQQCVCRFCTESQHKGHRVVHIDEESKERKVQMGTTQADFEHKIEERQNKVEEIQNKAAEQRAKGLVGELRREIAELQSRNAELAKLMGTDDHLILLQVSLSVHTEAELIITVVFLTPSDMKQLLVPTVDVELDPDTAHPNICLLDNGKRVGRAEMLRIVPENPQRFDPVICVLAKRGFLSGRFYFQVEVGSKTFWDVGVVKESVNRKGLITSKPENGFWTMRLRGGDEYRALDSPSVLLTFDTKPQTVGVFTDYEEGTVSFFDVDARSHIYTFAGCVFCERVFPFFSPGLSGRRSNVQVYSEGHDWDDL